jgi:hypothetical protein
VTELTGRQLNLASHLVNGVHGKIHISHCTDIEVHKGKNGAYYFLDMYDFLFFRFLILTFFDFAFVCLTLCIPFLSFCFFFCIFCLIVLSWILVYFE